MRSHSPPCCSTLFYLFLRAIHDTYRTQILHEFPGKVFCNIEEMLQLTGVMFQIVYAECTVNDKLINYIDKNIETPCFETPRRFDNGKQNHSKPRACLEVDLLIKIVR